jgi:hypothetical protein
LNDLRFTMDNLRFKKSALETRFSIFILLFAITIISGCHHAKKTKKSDTSQTTTTTPTVSSTISSVDANVQQVLTNLKKNELNFTELTAKMKTKVTSPDLKQSFTTNIRWKKGEKIWLSMSIIGIEGARVLITKDSIKIMDKINDRYILKPLSYLKQKALIDLSFSDIENLLLGQLLFFDASKAKYANNATNITLTSDALRFLTTVLFNKPSGFLNSIFVTDKMYTQTVSSAYTNYQTVLNKQFSMDRLLIIKSEGKTFELDLKFQNINSTQNLEYPFSINPNYTIEK